MNGTEMPNYVGSVVGIENPAGQYVGTYFVTMQNATELVGIQLGDKRPWLLSFASGMRVVPAQCDRHISDEFGRQILDFAILGEPEATDPKFFSVYYKARAVIHRLRMELDATNKAWAFADRERDRLLREIDSMRSPPDCSSPEQAEDFTHNTATSMFFDSPPQPDDRLKINLDITALPSDFVGDIHLHVHQ